jgi:hypothetical protein
MNVTMLARTAVPAALAAALFTASDAHAICDDFSCGSNTAVFNNDKIGPLSLLGDANAAGFRLKPTLYRFDWPSEGYRMDMKNGELIAVDPITNVLRASGLDLENSWFVLERVDPAGTVMDIAPVEIRRVAHVGLFREPRGSAYATAYELVSPASNPPHLCPEKRPWAWDTGPTVAADGTPLMPWNRQGRYAFLVGGETYEAWSASVDMWGSAAAPWFNIACAGTALSKMKLMGYDPQDSTSPTTPEQRQATLKMLTARYCWGRRELAFTVEGTPLVWQNADYWFDPLVHDDGTIGTLEAVWNQDGAICLNAPRRDGATSAPVWTIADVRAECLLGGAAPPPCPTGWDLDNVPAGAEWVTFTSTRPMPP